jgi:protein-S-isoprenylcysteine O-methyltransferase Ste14
VHINLKDLVAQIGIVLIVYALPVFLATGLQAWPAGWTFLVLWFGFWLVLLIWLYRHNPALLQERLRVSSADQQSWDRLFSILINVVLFAWLLFVCLDARRWHWSGVPVWLQVVGAILLLGAFYVFFRTFRENEYLSPLVRLQEERGQIVISSGQYGHVRHPMYAAMLLVVIGVPLLLGAWSGVIVGLVFIMVLARRAILEEATLRKALPGYADYLAKVKYRFIPYIW